MPPSTLCLKSLPLALALSIAPFAALEAKNFEPEAIPSQYAEMAKVDALDASSALSWDLKTGSNAVANPIFGWSDPAIGIQSPILKLEMSRKNPALESTQGSWFGMKREIAKPSEWKGADGICIVFALEKPCNWWLSMGISSNGEGYEQPLLPYEYDKGAVFVTRLLPFSQFKTKAGKSEIDLDKASSISFGGVACDNTLYIKSLFLYKIDRSKTGFQFSSSKTGLNVYERGEPVELIFKASQKGERPTALEVEIKDYFDKVAFHETVKPVEGDSAIFKAFPGPMPCGYYDVKAWTLDEKGQRLMQDSCIAGSGSLENGRGTFAVMPRTIEENNARRDKYLDKAFFGLHGSYMNLADLLGVSWRNGYNKWPWMEPEKPSRESGTAKWASDLMAKTKPAPERDLHLLNLGVNCHGIPKWAASDTPEKAPGLKDWSSFLDYFADYIKVERHQYPHMKRRIYDVAWEINLNSPSSKVQRPIYTEEDVVELFKRARAVVDDNDKGSMLIGPCTSTVDDNEWVARLFKAGLLNYIDAIEEHTYHAPPPERSKVAEKIRELKSLIKKYNDGKDLDIYCTELGYRSKYGSSDRHKEQAQWHVRMATILKGEGLKAHLPFYPYDMEGEESSWGICYDLDAKFTWGPKSLSPKAAVPALAVCVDQLEGAEPVACVPYFGSDIYAYVFMKEGEPLMAIWSVEERHKVALKASEAPASKSALLVTDIMGAERTVACEDSMATLEISPSILYVRGLSKKLYGGPIGQESIAAKSFPGGAFKAQGADAAGIISTSGIALKAEGQESLSGSVSGKVLPGIYPLFKKGDAFKWLIVEEPLEIDSVEPALRDGMKGVEIKVSNRGPEELNVSLSLGNAENGTLDKALKIEAASSAKAFFPLKNAEPGKSYKCAIEAKPEGMSPVRASKRLNFLAAHLLGEASDAKLPNAISWKGKGSSGRIDSANAKFTWDDSGLQIDIAVDDDYHCQSHSDASIWMEDGIQIAFDTDPELEDLYNPLGGIFTKKLTELAFALDDKGQCVVWRHKTYDEAQLKSGDASKAIKAEISRDAKAGVTSYKIGIPWKEIGLEKVRKGKPLGIAILVNDMDPNGKRAGIELFGGIFTDKNHSLYGTLLLQ